MRIAAYLSILGAALLAGGGPRETSAMQLEKLSTQGAALDGKRVTVEAYILDQGADGASASFPAVAGNADPKRPAPVANGCPTEDLSNLLIRFRDPSINVSTMEGKHVTLSGVYHSVPTFLDLPSVNAKVFYDGYIDGARIENIHQGSCTFWVHTDDGILR